MDDANAVGVVPRLVEETASTLGDLAEALAGEAHRLLSSCNSNRYFAPNSRSTATSKAADCNKY